MDDQERRHRDGELLRAESAEARAESSVADVPGSPTWPTAQVPDEVSAPAVGLQWRSVAERTGVDIRILRHEGQIVLPGEYFTGAGFYLDPLTMEAQHVDVGDRVLAAGYFIGNLTAREFGEWFRIAPPQPRAAPGRIVMRGIEGPIRGLFADRHGAERSATAIRQGSVGTGIHLEEGPLGVEMRIDRPEEYGKVASVIASHGGAVISAGGVALRGPGRTTAPVLAAAEADTYRPGTGATSDSESAATRPGSSDPSTRG